MGYSSQSRRAGTGSNRASDVRRRMARAGAFATEALERRLLLRAPLSAQIPAQIDPAATQQALFVPGVSTSLSNTPATVGAVGAKYYRFSVDNATVGQVTTFSTFAANNALADTGLALYDGDGNLLQTADADKPAPGIESLQATLDSRMPYILGVFSSSFVIAVAYPVTLTTDTGAQRVNSTIVIDPTAGTADFLANSGEDTFNSPTDVNYFPLDLTNAGASAAVTISAAGPDTKVYAAVYRQDGPTSPFQQVASGSGAPVTLNVAPANGFDLTDANFFLAVAPLNFDSAAQPYEVQVSAPKLVGPATVAPDTATDVGPLLPISAGAADLMVKGSTAGGSKLYKLRAVADGAITLTTVTQPVSMSIYDATGATLLGVESRSIAGQGTFTFNATAGTTYLVRVGNNPSQPAAANLAFTLEAQQAYAGTPVTVGGAVGQQTAGMTPHVFQLSPPAGADLLVLQLTPDAGDDPVAPAIAVVGANQPAVQRSAAAGSPILLVIDLNAGSGPVDVLTYGTAGSGTVTLAYAAVTLPKQIAIDQLQNLPVDIKTGQLSSTLTAAPFGQLGGVQFYQISASSTVLKAQGSAGIQPLLVRYVQEGGVLKLGDKTLPDATGAATLTANLQGTLFYAAAAVSLNFTGNGTVQLSVSQPPPAAVGVGTVPEPHNAGDPFKSFLRIRDVILHRTNQRDLFETILPFNMTAAPTLTFAPVSKNSPLAATVTVLDAANNVLATGTSAPGQQLTIPLTGVTPAAFAGKKLRFLIEPVAGQSVGDGTYTLQVEETTSDPTPFLLDDSLLPPVAAQTLNFNSTIDGNFTSSQPQVQLFKLSLPSFLSYRMWTEDLDASTNTDIRLYRARYIPGSGIFGPQLIGFEPLAGISPSLDYFPADRSSVDSRIIINNTHVFDGAFTDPPNQPNTLYSPGRNVVYLAVKNEQGCQGRFRVHFDFDIPKQLGPGSPDSFFMPHPATVITLDPTTGSGSLPPFATVGPSDLVLFNTPHSLTSNPVVTVTSTSANDIATVDLYDAAGNLLNEGRALVFNGVGIASFTYHMSPSSLYIIRTSLANSTAAKITISASMSTQNAPNKPASTDALTTPGSFVNESEPFDRADQAPDGTFIQRIGLTGSGTQEKLLFWVPATGPVHLSVTTHNVNNGSFALYRGVGASGELNGFIGGTLLDFVSTPTGGTYSFDDYLSPGFYYLRLVGTVPGGADGVGDETIIGSVPAFDATNIILDPNSGQNSSDNLQTVDRADPLFSTSFYEVDTPGGVQSSLTVNFTALASPPAGEADFALYKRTPDGRFVEVGSQPQVYFDFSPTMPFTVADSEDSPTAGDQYFIGINRDRLSADILVAPGFKIPQSGDPDLVVKSVAVLSNFGHTQVVVTVKNQAFAGAPVSNSLFTLSNYTYPAPSIPGQRGSLMQLNGIGPLGFITYIGDWDPDAPTDTVSYTANVDRKFAEISFDNNSSKVALSSVDRSFPSVSLSLADPTLTAEPGVWGRYVSDVPGVRTDVRLNSTDADGDLFFTQVTGPFALANTGNLGAAHTDRVSVDFGMLDPTSAVHPNIADGFAIDAFGLKSQHVTQKVDVVVKPGFLTSIDWDPAAKRYNLAFVHNFVDYDKTLSQILGLDLPLVGDKHNQFLIGASAMGTASLDPRQAVSLPLTGHILLKALDSSLYDKSFTGSAQASDHLTVKTTLTIDSRSLSPTAAAVSFILSNLNLFHYRTPLIKLYSYGLPGVASIDVGVRFGLDADLSAGVKVGIDPNVLFNPLIPTFPLGLLSPTFIQPTITGNATVEGDVEVLGFDLASLQGTVSLGLRLTIGLDNNDPAKVFAFDDFFNHLAVKVDAILGIHLEADVFPFGDVWDFDYSKTFPVSDTSKEGIITDDAAGGKVKSDAAFAQIGKFLANPGSLVAAGAADGVTPVVRHGSDRVGPYRLVPSPQIVIDPASGDGLSVQVENVSPDPNVTTGNLVYATRANGQWSALTPLASADVGNPTLAFSHDRDNLNPAVVAYEADNGAGDPATQSINQRLADNEIRYRYYDGEGNWGTEQAITQDSQSDSSPSLAFNKVGAGVVAWVHDTSDTPMDENGQFARDAQEIQAAVWDPATHTFLAPMSITSGDGVADTKPAAFVDSDGNPYVVWVRDIPGGGNTLMFSIYDGANWSAPAVLAITGLTPGGNFGSVALGTDQLGRVNVLFSYRIQNADGSIDSRLFNRPGTKDAFGSPTPVEQIAQDGNFSHLRTTNAGDGSLVAYWQLGDGVDNGVFESTLARSAASPSLPWSTPTRLTSTPDLTQAPSLAVDTGGTLDVMYEASVPKGEVAPAVVSDVPIGVPLAPGVGSSSVAMLPELTFTNGLFFPYQDSAAEGTTATGQATIMNRGAVASQVTIESFVGSPDAGTLIDTRHITLSAGGSYNYSQLFPVSSGAQTYSVRISSATGEAVSTDDDVSTATLNGLPDITVLSVTPSVVSPAPGQTITLNAQVQNVGSVAVGPFDVALYSGDRRFPQTHPALLLTQTVDSIAPGATITVSFSITLPDTAGDYTYTVAADPANAIIEAVNSNNDAQYRISFRADPAIAPAPADAVTATLLDGSGVNNVKVTVPVSNLGNVDLANVPVILQLSRDGSDFVNVATQTVPLLSAGAGTTIAFTTNGLSGDNIYRAIIDPALNGVDNNTSNNVGQTHLVIHGVADLSVASVNLSNTNPPQGAPLTVTAAIANAGIADATNVLVELFATPDGGDPIPVGAVRLDQVPALGQTTATFTIDTSALLGHYTLLVQVNRLHEVLESTELNDTATSEFTVGAAVMIPTSNIVNGVAGIANTIILRRDPTDSTRDDVWINVAETELPTQFALIGQPIIVNSGGVVDKLVLDPANGDPLPVELDLNGSFTTDAVAINAGESIVLDHTAALHGNQLTVTGLTIDPAAKLDLGDGSVRISYAGASPLSAIRGYLASGYAGGAWTGNGLTSADAAGHAGNALGTADDGTAVTVQYTRAGDTNLDGKVNFSDLLALAQHYNATDANWLQGDFNYDGKVGFNDLLVLAQQYNQSVTASSLLKQRTARRPVGQ